jgi:hypothetical protein
VMRAELRGSERLERVYEPMAIRFPEWLSEAR